MTDVAALMNYQIDEMPQPMEVRTEKISFTNKSNNNNIYTFQLQPTGFLDSNALLVFKLKAKDQATSDDNCRLNCFNGALGALKSVQFKIGDQLIQRIEDVNLWSTLNRFLIFDEDKRNKFKSHYYGNALYGEILKDGDQRVHGVNSFTGSVFPDNVKCGIDYGTSSGAGATVLSQKIHFDSSENHLMGIPLGDILPLLFREQFPLFLVPNENKIILEFEFESQSSKFCNKMSNNNYGANENLACSDGDIVVDPESVELLVDYLIFSSASQEATRQKSLQEGGLLLSYHNINTIKKHIPAATVNKEQQIEHRLGLQNQEIHYLQQFKQLSDGAAKGSNKVFLDQRSDSISIESYQYNLNGADQYPEGFRMSPCVQYDQLNECLSSDAKLIKPIYQMDVNSEYSLLSPYPSGLSGTFKVLGVDMQNDDRYKRGGGSMNGQYPIIFKYRRRPHAAITKTVSGRAGVDIGKKEDGALDCTYFAATTRSVNIVSKPSGEVFITTSDL